MRPAWNMAGAARRRLLIIFNPAAGARRREHLGGLLRALDDLGCTVDVAETEAPGHATELARGASPGRYDLVAAAGGDGTINEVLNGLAGRRLPLALLPLGTTNVLASEIGLAEAPDAIARAVALGPIRPIALGRANGRYFAGFCGVGFDARTVAEVDAGMKRRLGKLAYVVASLRQLWAPPGCIYQVRVGRRRWRVASVIVANGRYYGGSYVLAPWADLANASFEVAMFREPGRLDVLRFGGALLLDRLSRTSGVEMISGVQRLEIRGPKGEPIQTDGDLGGELPLTLEIVPDAIDLVYPSAAVLGWHADPAEPGPEAEPLPAAPA